jgi:hypothetical protein
MLRGKLRNPAFATAGVAAHWGGSRPGALQRQDLAADAAWRPRPSIRPHKKPRRPSWCGALHANRPQARPTTLCWLPATRAKWLPRDFQPLKELLFNMMQFTVPRHIAVCAA